MNEILQEEEEQVGQSMVVRPAAQAVVADELSVDDIVAQAEKIHDLMRKGMKDGEHFGTIGGVKRPTLLKPGAEKLCLMFRLDPEYDSQMEWEGEHLLVKSKCTLFHIPTGNRIGSGEGLCTTREAKYAWRKGERLCPVCNQPAIIKGKAEYGGGWVCYGKKGGCGSKFEDGDARIESQMIDRVANPDLPDTYNTVIKMANKRALVAAVLNATAASDVFTQDVEDNPPPPTEVEKTARPRRKKATKENVDELKSAIKALSYSDKWSEENVLRGAQQKWGLDVKKIEDLTDDEIREIVAAAQEFLYRTPPPVAADVEPVTVDQSDFEPPKE